MINLTNMTGASASKNRTGARGRSRKASRSTFYNNVCFFGSKITVHLLYLSLLSSFFNSINDSNNNNNNNKGNNIIINNNNNNNMLSSSSSSLFVMAENMPDFFDREKANPDDFYSVSVAQRSKFDCWRVTEFSPLECTDVTSKVKQLGSIQEAAAIGVMCFPDRETCCKTHGGCGVKHSNSCWMKTKWYPNECTLEQGILHIATYT